MTKTTIARRPLVLLTLLAGATGLIYAAVAGLSTRFAYDHAFAQRPIPAVLGLLGAAFVCYLAALAVAVNARDDRRLLWLIVVSGVVFRLVLIPTWPIQEVDIYRYLWDGQVAACGVSPFRYSPEQVLSASSSDRRLPEDFRRLVRRRDASPAVATILSRVHYGELPTIYPPTSQAIFLLWTWATPADSSVLQRIIIAKTFLVAFDLATLGLIVGLLQLVGRHRGWSLAYAWCPLVMKEFANSGHLDAIAVFLTTLAVFVVVCAMGADRRSRALAGMILGAGILAMAVGAKLYPVVLLPLLAAACGRKLGWSLAALPLVVFCVLTTGVLWPMVPRSGSPGVAAEPADDGPPPIPEDTSDRRPPTPRDGFHVRRQDPSLGLKTFLSRWEMNDFLFLVVVENLKPQAGMSPDRRPWFSVVPEPWRLSVLEVPERWLKRKLSSVAFLLTRLVTGVVFLLLAIVLAWRAARRESATEWLRAAFLTLAWFWLLSPTQNPWYWVWVLPLVAFARSRLWLAVSGLALVYYLRFWLLYHWPGEPVLGTGYDGSLFFDYVVTWLEFAPWLVCLTVAWLFHRLGCRNVRILENSCG